MALFSHAKNTRVARQPGHRRIIQRLLTATTHRLSGRDGAGHERQHDHGTRSGYEDELVRWPRRVLVLNWRDPWHPEAGGAEVMLHEHVKRWVSQGHEITLFTAHYPGAKREEVRDGMRIVRRGGKFSVYAWTAILYLTRLRREADAVLDIENGIPFFTPLYSCKPRLCLVHHVHRNQFLWEFGPVLGRIGRSLEGSLMPLVYRRTRFVAVSESTRDELAAIGIDPSRCRVVHNGVDHEAYRPVVKRSATPRLVYLGRLKKHKRIDLVIDLCGRLRQHFPSLVLDIVGTGDDEPRLRALADSKGLQDYVHFHGFTSHARKLSWLSAAWALVTATEREGWGLSIIEAAACGTPTLCLDAPGVRDAVDHGASGWLAPDTEALYQATFHFLEDSDWRHRLSQGALDRAEQFTWTTSAARAREALTEVWLDRTSLPQRRVVDGVAAAPKVEREVLEVTARAEVVPALRAHVRDSDRIHVHDGVIHVELASVTPDDIHAVKNRLQRVVRNAGPLAGNANSGRGDFVGLHA